MKQTAPLPAQKSKLSACLLCAALGGLVFLAIYGIRPLDATYDAWIFNGYVETDITQRYAGWLAYRNSAAFFPLTFSSCISFPFGGYTSLCDSIPLFEVFFKALSPLLPETFQFEGILCLLNLVLQGFCGGLAVSLFTGNRAAIVLGGGLFCFSPILLERLFRHTSLSFQWMLLLCIWLYFSARRSGSLRYFAGFAVLGAGSVWLHLYFTPMILGFFLAAVLDHALSARSGAAFAAPFGLFCLSAAGAVGGAALLGDLSLGGNTSGYGTMGLNLNALFNPKSLGPNWWVPGQGTISWSLFLPMRATAENGLESFNYLGLGILLGLCAAAAFALLRARRHPALLFSAAAEKFRAYPALSAFLAFSTLFAISSVVCAFSHVLIRIPLPAAVAGLFSAFRASGRLFWSVNEMLVLCCVVFWLRHAGAAQPQAAQSNARPRAGRAPAPAVLLLAAILAVQAVDLSPALAAKHADFAARQSWAGEAQAARLAEAMQGRTVLYNLELRDDRPTCAYLLKQGISSNFWLISRDAYGVPELTADMAQTTAALLAGTNPYPSAAYCTADADTAVQLAEAGCNVMPVGDVWVILPAE